MTTPGQEVSDPEQDRIRSALKRAVGGGGLTMDAISKRAQVSLGFLSAFRRGTRKVRHEGGTRICEVLGIPAPSEQQALHVEPLWAAAAAWQPDRVTIELTGRSAVVQVERRGEITRAFKGRTVSDIVAEMQRCAS